MKKLFIFVYVLTLCCLSSCGSKGYLEFDYVENYEYLDDTNNVFKKVDYDKVMSLLNDKDAKIIYFGGAWCPNCQTAAPFINEVAKELGIKTVYNFDTRVNGNEKKYDIRNCMDVTAKKQYADLINVLGYENPEGTVVTLDGEDVLDENGNTIARMPVPTLVAIKDGKLLGFLTREYYYDSEKDAVFVDLPHYNAATGENEYNHKFDGDEINVKDEFLKEIKDILNLIK